MVWQVVVGSWLWLLEGWSGDRLRGEYSSMLGLWEREGQLIWMDHYGDVAVPLVSRAVASGERTGLSQGSFNAFELRLRCTSDALALCVRVHLWPTMYPLMRLCLCLRCIKRQRRLLESLVIPLLLVLPSNGHTDTLQTRTNYRSKNPPLTHQRNNQINIKSN